TIHVIDPNARCAGGPRKLALTDQLPELEPGAWRNESPEWLQDGRLARASRVLRPLHTAFARSAEQIQIAVPVPVHDERIAMRPFDLDGQSLRFRRKFPVAFSREQIERSGKGADHEIELAISIPIHRERSRADVFGLVSPTRDGNDERRPVRALQNLRRFEFAAGLSPKNLEQSCHRSFHARIRPGKNVAVAIVVEIHKLWSRTGASPDSGNFGHLAFGSEPFTGRELST